MQSVHENKAQKCIGNSRYIHIGGKSREVHWSSGRDRQRRPPRFARRGNWKSKRTHQRSDTRRHRRTRSPPPAQHRLPQHQSEQRSAVWRPLQTKVRLLQGDPQLQLAASRQQIHCAGGTETGKL